MALLIDPIIIILLVVITQSGHIPIGKKLLNETQKRTREEIRKSNIENYDRQGWLYKLTHKRPE